MCHPAMVNPLCEVEMVDTTRGMKPTEAGRDPVETDYAVVVTRERWGLVAKVICGLPDGYFETDFPLPVSEQRVLKRLFNAPWGVHE